MIPTSSKVSRPRSRTRTARIFSILAALATVIGLLRPLAQAPSTYASTVSLAAFAGGSGTVTVGGTLYAKQGGALTLSVTTSSDTKCVDVSGAFTGHQQSSTAKTSWTFGGFTAPAGDGVQSVSVVATPNFNAQNKCTGSSGSGSAAYILDNTGPAVTATLSPVANGAGWNNSNVTINWSATDAGSGVGSGPTPATDSVTANTAGVTKSSSATDRLGNSGSGSVTVKLDKAAPTISGNRSPAANANGWNNTDVTVSFTCSDNPAPPTGSGINTCSGPTTLSSNGAGQSVTGTAVDNADNSASTTVSGINIDKTAPSLSGAPTSSPNGNGWYKSNVTVHWTCSDTLSGIAGSCPADSTISSEGSALTASASVSDKAGNSTTAISSPTVKIDKTAPNTTATAPANWNNTNVTVSLNANDTLSGVDNTYYTLDGGAQQSGTSVSISSEGIHTLEFWSVDKAGNEESHKTVQVKIDKTPPSINHTQSPAANANGWNNGEVTVTFVCSDALSGIASCTSAQTVTTEGKNKPVTGTATDNAGNSATDPATVSIDKTPPTISAAADRAANANGWYNADVTVSFTCGDALSGIDTCPTAQTLGEGANQSASGTAADAAGNTNSASVSPINVDKTAPTLTGAATTSPNGNGWYNGDVTINWTCGDGLSGIDGSCPPPSTITGEGATLSASASVSDLAGNSQDRTVSGIKIDRTAPGTTASVPAPLDSGWYAGAVPVTLTSDDNLSGVATTYYSVDGGGAQTYSGPFSVSGGGSHTVTFWSMDNADNVEDKTADGHSITLKIDNVPPSITGSRTPAANGFGWNNIPVTVSFDCADAESGIADCSGPTTLSDEGAGQSVQGNAQDNAGNSASATVSDINIDLTPPQLTPVLPDPVGEGQDGASWYNGDVAVQWNALDTLSGIDSATQPAPSTITGEGRNLDLAAGAVSVSDKAGNVTLSGALGGVNIDRRGPTISATQSGKQGLNGWYTGSVAVDFQCTDPALADGSAGSGVAACPTTKSLLGDGANQSVMSDPAKDYAGNSTSGLTVGGINVDGTPPQTSANNTCTKVDNYCKGASAIVNLTANDATSGVSQIYYRITTGTTVGAWKSTAASNGQTVGVTVPLDGSGHASVDFYAVDTAGNQEPQNSVELLYDNIAPTITHTANPKANDAGWNNGNVAITWSAKDDDAGSGVNASTWNVTPASIGSSALASSDGINWAASSAVNTETSGSGTAINATVDDKAANTGTDGLTVKVDKTAPTISAAVSPSSPTGKNGWYVSPVTVSFACSDALSGIPDKACPDSVSLSGSGANQSVTRSVSDAAGNSSSATSAGVNVDVENPTITSVSVAGGTYQLGGVPAASCTATDSFSGVDSCTVQTSGPASGVGTFSYTATATDKAGNTATQTGTYKVSYRFDKFLQPINDTAHTGQKMSIFKAGSTIPVKFQLKNAAGTPIQAASAPTFVNVGKVGLMTGGANSTGTTDAADTGLTYRYDSSGQQYIYNWKSPNDPNGVYRIGVKFDDGASYTVDIGLK